MAYISQRLLASIKYLISYYAYELKYRNQEKSF